MLFFDFENVPIPNQIIPKIKTFKKRDQKNNFSRIFIKYLNREIKTSIVSNLKFFKFTEFLKKTVKVGSFKDNIYKK